MATTTTRTTSGMASNVAEMLHCTQLVLTRQPVLPAKLFKNARRGCCVYACVCVCVCVMYMTLGHNKLTTFDHMDTGQSWPGRIGSGPKCRTQLAYFGKKKKYAGPKRISAWHDGMPRKTPKEILQLSWLTLLAPFRRSLPDNPLVRFASHTIYNCKLALEKGKFLP